jgi:hypothetical protein
MGRNNTLLIALLLGVTTIGCSVGGPSQSDDEGGVDDGSGSGGDDGSGGGGDPGGPDVDDDGTLPTYPTAHPRIYLGTQKDRLQATLTASTATSVRFKAKVDQ